MRTLQGSVLVARRDMLTTKMASVNMLKELVAKQSERKEGRKGEETGKGVWLKRKRHLLRVNMLWVEMWS